MPRVGRTLDDRPAGLADPAKTLLGDQEVNQGEKTRQ